MLKEVRCAIYTRKSNEDGLEQKFNSLDAQRVACEKYIKSREGYWPKGMMMEAIQEKI